jgi:hypothetical protein
MIPHRMPSSEIFGNGLKQRVTACRRRLRVNRNLHRVQSREEVILFTSETAASFPGEHPPVRESLPGGSDAAEFRDPNAWQRVEQEVGIT